MDVLYRSQGLEFVWNIRKAATNAAKHGVTFEQACEAFFDPLILALDAEMNDEARDALLGESEQGHLLFVVHIEREGIAIRIISARHATSAERKRMKIMRERLKTRLQRGRPMTTISLRMPEDVIGDLKEIAPMLGFTGYEPLMRSYIGQGLRKDLSRLSGSQMEALTQSLRKQGIADGQIAAALAEAGIKTA